MKMAHPGEDAAAAAAVAAAAEAPAPPVVMAALPPTDGQLSYQEELARRAAMTAAVRGGRKDEPAL